MNQRNEALLIGIGNTGRNDDGLGWLFADKVAATMPGRLDVEYRYQLQPEDAEIVSRYKTVFFADASVTVFDTGFEIKPCILGERSFHSSHAQSPETILFLAEHLYNALPLAFTIAVTGCDWNFGSNISPEAKKNAENAMISFRQAIGV